MHDELKILVNHPSNDMPSTPQRRPNRTSCPEMVAIVALGLGLGLPVRACDPPAGRLVSAEAVVEVRALGQGPWIRI